MFVEDTLTIYVSTGTSLNYTWEDPSKPHEVQWWPAKQEKIKTTATVSFDADGTVSFPFGLDMSMVGDSSNVGHEDFDDISSEASILMSSAKSKTSTAVYVYLIYFRDRIITFEKFKYVNIIGNKLFSGLIMSKFVRIFRKKWGHWKNFEDHFGSFCSFYNYKSKNILFLIVLADYY